MDFGSDDFSECAKIVDNTYRDTYQKLQEVASKDKKVFNANACIWAMVKFKTEQVASLIGDNLTDYDKDILSGVIERHIAGVVYKG